MAQTQLRGLIERVGRKEMAMFNRIVIIAESAGGKVGNILQKCSRMVAENRLLKLDLETELTQVKQDTKTMFILMILSLTFFRVSNSELFNFYQKSQGEIVMLILLGLGAALVYIAGRAARPKELE
jgi:Flp pilus assembly protein TadB